jgi:thioredoxin reductase (NADPH)
MSLENMTKTVKEVEEIEGEEMNNKVYEFDTVILGGGPAGLSAAIYAARGAASTAIIDKSMLGGQPTNYLELENYPGFGLIDGFDLMENFEKHADRFNVNKFPMQEIDDIDLTATIKTITTKEATFKAKTVIIATGAQSKKLGIPGEKEFLGRGVSYCAVCDGAFYREKTVAVIGGGNAAVEEAMYLTKFADKVYIIHRRDTLRADKIVQERAFNNKKIEFIFDAAPTEILGDDLVNTLVLRNTKTNAISRLETNGVFPYIGYSPNIDGFNGHLKQDEGGFIITDETMQTSVEGVFAVGDVRNTPLRQVITAASDGAVGAVYAVKYLETLSEVLV